jgi:hypothetical protein
MAGTLDGGKSPHVDLQGDAIEVNSTEFIKVCAEYMESGAASDVMHDERQDGRIVFAMPLVKEVNDALGIKSDVEGLAIAMKPSAEAFKRFQSGELAAFSIFGSGQRDPIQARKGATIPVEIKLDPESLAALKANTAAPKSTQPTAPLETQVKMETKIIVLTDAQHAHYAKLAGAEADAFLTKSSTERDSVLADIAKADAVVFKGEPTGIEVRKSHGPMAMQLAELAEKNAAVTKTQAETIAKRDEEIEKSEVRKQATETLGSLTGSDDMHDLIIRSVKKSGAKAEDIGAALEAMKGWNTLAATAGTAKGANPGKDPVALDSDAALKALEKGLVSFAKANNIDNVWTVGLEKFKATDEGAALKRAYDESLNG